MARRYLIVFLIGCGASSPPAAPPQTAAAPTTPTAPARPSTATPKPPASSPSPPAAPPCDPEGFALECRCNEGDTPACIQLAEAELRSGAHDVAFARGLALCQAGHPTACFVAAKVLQQKHIASKHGTTAKDLRSRGVSILETKCKASELDACLEHARLLMAGKLVARDYKRAAELADTACTGKLARGCVLLGNMYATGQGVKKDTKRARALLDEACTAGTASGCASLGLLLEKTDKTKALALFERACAGDDATACAKTGAAAQKRGDRAKAAALLGKACELEHADSCVAAASFIVNDPARTRPMYQRACDGDIAAGCAALAPLVAGGQGGPRHFADGIELAEKSCKLQPKPPKTCALAAKLRAAPPQVSCTTFDACWPLCDDEKIPGACVARAELHIAAGPDSCGDAMEDLEAACKLGDGPSCVRRGHEERDTQEAGSWYTLGCNAKHEPACLMRDAAAGSDKSLRKRCKAGDQLACSWSGEEKLLRNACTAGVARACRELAVALENYIPPEGVIGIGDGSPEEMREIPGSSERKAEAATLYAQACKLGDEDACVTVVRSKGGDPDSVPHRCGGTPLWDDGR